MVKRLACWFVLILIQTAVLCAVDFTALKPEGYVSDFAQVIDSTSHQQIEQYCARVEKTTGVQMAIVTLPSLGGEPAEDVANALFRKWGIGQKNKDNGILLLLSIGDRRSRLEVGYGLEPIITDADAGTVLRAMRPYLREGRYGDALMEAAATLGNQIEEAKNGSSSQHAPHPVTRRQESPVLPAIVLVGGFLLFIGLAALLGARRRLGGYRRNGGGGIRSWLPWLIIGNMTGHGWSSDRGGGGFGGFDSGGFGGFGGGDSGGGGASSSW